MDQYLEFRHRMIDAFVARQRPDALVEIGAGLSQRGLAWALDRDVRCLEIDLPRMVARKTRALEKLSETSRRRAATNLEIVALDVLSSRFGAILGEWLAPYDRPVVVAEGLVSYFDFGQRSTLFSSIASAFRRNRRGSFVCDLHIATPGRSLELATRVLETGIRVVTRGQGARPPFRDRAHVESCLREAGFDAVEVLQPQDYIAVQPRLAEVFSPASIVAARVDPVTRSARHRS
jgi:O-methyltransferase involved in polyketide biosynthesis